MISHVVLYRFPASTDESTRTGFADDLRDATARTGVVQRFTCGEHVPLPADDHAQHAMYSLAGVWEFAHLADLHTFSQHPVMCGFVDEWVRSLGIEVAFANYAPDRPAHGAAS